MPAQQKFVPLAGSERDAVAGAKIVGDVDPNETFDITVRVRPHYSVDKEALLKDLMSKPPAERQYLSRDEFSEKFGSDPADIEKVKQYAREKGLTIGLVSPGARTVTLGGTAKQLTDAFPTELKLYDSPSGRFRGRTGPVQIPQQLQGVVEGIFGFDNRPQAQTR